MVEQPTKQQQTGQSVRVRFAPSPTGHMHIGNLRTALFNWLFARHTGGVFLLRIEDTDLERSLPEYTDSIVRSLAWMGIESDEPLVIQSQQHHRHQEVAQRLLAQGKAYKCFCSPEALKERLGESAAEEGYVQYDALCRTLQPAKGTDTPYVIRFKVPHDIAEITFNDLIRGPITFKREQLDDFILVRSDGSPMYNFVVVVDDADMGITHVIRGEDHISNTPKQLLLYQACGFMIPAFAHLSLILGPHGNRLSKRDAATAVIDYQREGFLADALFNYLVRLGWSHGDQELFTKDELIEYFALAEVGKKGAIFDMAKLSWMNGVYIRSLTPETLVRLIVRDVDPKFRTSLSWLTDEQLMSFVTLYTERSKTLSELAKHVKSLAQGPTEQERDAVNTTIKEHYPLFITVYKQYLEKAIEKLEHLTPDTSQSLIKELCQQLSIRLPDIAHPLRIALIGQTTSPSVHALLAALGKDEVLKRLRALPSPTVSAC
jgi:glutamyl-tRNA synthetase